MTQITLSEVRELALYAKDRAEPPEADPGVYALANAVLMLIDYAAELDTAVRNIGSHPGLV